MISIDEMLLILAMSSCVIPAFAKTRLLRASMELLTIYSLFCALSRAEATSASLFFLAVIITSILSDMLLICVLLSAITEDRIYYYSLIKSIIVFTLFQAPKFGYDLKRTNWRCVCEASRLRSWQKLTFVRLDALAYGKRYFFKRKKTGSCLYVSYVI